MRRGVRGGAEDELCQPSVRPHANASRTQRYVDFGALLRAPVPDAHLAFRESVCEAVRVCLYCIRGCLQPLRACRQSVSTTYAHAITYNGTADVLAPPCTAPPPAVRAAQTDVDRPVRFHARQYDETRGPLVDHLDEFVQREKLSDQV